MADIFWPTTILKPMAGKSKIVAATISGGRSISGLEQVVQSDAGYWRLTMAQIRIGNNEALRTYNVIEATLQGRGGTALVPFLDCHRAPWPVINGVTVTSNGSQPWSDGTLFNDGTGWLDPVIIADMVDEVAAGATTATIRIIVGSALLAGMHWQAGERGYRIQRVLSETIESADSTLYSIQFWPPARDAIPAGTSLNFDDPRFLARLETDDEMDFDAELWKHGRPTLNFIEAIDP